MNNANIHKYGVKWVTTAKLIPDDESSYNVEIGIINSILPSLSLAGLLHVDICFGPYVEIDRVNPDHMLATPLRLYSDNLGKFCTMTEKLSKQKEWYYELRNTYTFSKETIIRINPHDVVISLGKLSNRILELSEIFVPIPNIVSIDSLDKTLLTICKDIYKQLPNRWTVQDLYAPIQSQLNYMYNLYDQPWREIATALAEKKSIKLLISEKDGFLDNFRVYHWKQTKYNIVIQQMPRKNTVYCKSQHSEEKDNYC